MPTALSFNSLASTPSLDIEPDPDTVTRRNSSGTLLSPEVEGGIETDGFYLLKKDSQRRTTLSRVLAQDAAKICELWMKKLQEKTIGEPILTSEHLATLMGGLKEYITEQQLGVVESAIRALKEELDFDAAAINQLQFAIYLFQESVNEVLRLHSIKPHWMFALDNLVRSAIQAAITVLSPELGENLANHSAPSTVNSAKSGKSALPFDVREQVLQLRAENNRLMHDLVDSQKQYQNLIKQIIEDRKNQAAVLREALVCSRCHEDELPHDPCLSNWLLGLGVSEGATRRLLAEGYTLEDIRYYVTREDLRRVGLRGGSELKIWRAVQEIRGSQLCNGEVCTDAHGTV